MKQQEEPLFTLRRFDGEVADDYYDRCKAVEKAILEFQFSRISHYAKPSENVDKKITVYVDGKKQTDEEFMKREAEMSEQMQELKERSQNPGWFAKNQYPGTGSWYDREKPIEIERKPWVSGQMEIPKPPFIGESGSHPHNDQTVNDQKRIALEKNALSYIFDITLDVIDKSAKDFYKKYVSGEIKFGEFAAKFDEALEKFHGNK